MPPPADHPGPVAVCLPRAIADAITAHALAEAPLEACGIVPGTASAAEGGEPQRYEPCRNLAASRTRFELHPEDYYRVHAEVDAAGGALWGIVHSHPATAPVPSGLDLMMAAHPDALYLVVSPQAPERPLRAWRIVGRRAHEVAVSFA